MAANATQQSLLILGSDSINLVKSRFGRSSQEDGNNTADGLQDASDPENRFSNIGATPFGKGVDGRDRAKTVVAPSGGRARSRTVIKKDDRQEQSDLKSAKIVFFIAGIANAAAAASVFQALVYFSLLFGDQFTQFSFTAFLVPALPISALQTKFDDKYGFKYGSEIAFKFRIFVSWIVYLAIVFAIPFVSEAHQISSMGRQGILLAFVALIGMFDSIAYGGCSQMGSMMPGGKCNTYYFLGSSFSSFLILAIGFMTGVAQIEKEEDISSGKIISFFYVSAGLIALGIAAVAYLFKLKLTQRCLREADEALKQSEYAAPLVPSGSAMAASANAVTTRSLLADHWKGLVSCAVIFFIGGIPSSFYTVIKSTNPQLPLILLNIGNASALIGQQMDLVRKGRIIKGPRELFVCCLLNIAPLVIYCLIVRDSLGFNNDGFVIALLAFIQFFVGYLGSLCFSLVPASASEAARPKLTSLLNTFCFLGGIAGVGATYGIGAGITE